MSESPARPATGGAAAGARRSEASGPARSSPRAARPGVAARHWPAALGALVTVAVVAVAVVVVVVALQRSPRSHPGPDFQRPRADLTPGATDARVTQANLAQTVCAIGYAASVRPPSSWSSPTKRGQMADYGYGGRDPRGFEFDHLIPLEIGGAPEDLRNLWPQPIDEARVKDGEEDDLHAAVCSGRLTLAQAQQRMLQRWGPR